MASVLNPAIAAFVCSYMLAYVTQRIVSQALQIVVIVVAGDNIITSACKRVAGSR